MIAVVFLAACGWSAHDAATPVPDATFPHPGGFVQDHGQLALAGGCETCHAVSGDARGGPGCTTCHDYPHPDAFPEHGAVADASCDGCHGESGGRAPAGVAAAACVSCHNTYPHREGFLEVHGTRVHERGGATACVTCHSGGADCLACHPAYPHNSGFLQVHGASTGDCASCHTPRPAPAPPGCVSCHADYPHTEDWAQTHAAPARRLGVASCEGCHTDPLDGPDLPPTTCTSACHGVSP